ncbi:MAG: TonB-dependent receptor plug domain-containing protein [Spirochaetes bacterium]|nr:TonB-dependent receptor plug domain-containing protein [Spirochaetota bacterium]
MKIIRNIFLASVVFLIPGSFDLYSQTTHKNGLTDTAGAGSVKNITEDISLSQAPVRDKESSVKDNPADTDAGNIKDSKRTLKPLIIKGTRVKKKKEIQTVSRQTMTAEEIKEVPGSFGDSVRALTSLPGIISAYGGFFGPLVIRGADPISNNYFIDDIPVDNPLHFGGLHCVINTNLIKDIDVYSSSFPAEFGSSTAAIINITTIDDVNEFGGYTDLSLLTASALIRTPILTDKFGRLIADMPSHSEKEDGIENRGYFIASGRYGYITLGIKAAELITREEIPVSPEYWDYQVKSKYIVNSVHSLTMLLFGHKDFIRVLIKEDMLEEGADPYFADAKFKYNILSHSQALYLGSKFSKDFSNKVIYFSTLPDSYYYLDLPAENAPDWAKDFNYHARPWVFGVRDKVNYKWMNRHSEVRGAAEYTFYYFTAKGKTLSQRSMDDSGGMENLDADPMDDTIKNHKIGGYLENKFTYSGLTVLPGVRSDYLNRAKSATFDPRLMSSYKFRTDTTLSAAGGHYSYYVQTNPFIFNTNTDICGYGKELKPEKAWHLALGAEQEFDLLAFKMEFFKNYFYDKPVSYIHTEPDGRKLPGLSSGKQKTYGFEIMIRKDLRDNEDGLYGWMSYTYTRSKYKSGLPTGFYYKEVYQVDDNGVPYIGDKYGNRYVTSDYEQRHSLKFVSGYKKGNHTVSGKFQYYSGFPYTPIVDNESPVNGRYVPISGERNSKNFAPYWQLDMRYTRRIPHSWGYISWYVEIINIFMNKEYEYKWYWDREYSPGSNPVMKKQEGYNFLPNFGVEVKF